MYHVCLLMLMSNNKAPVYLLEFSLLKPNSIIGKWKTPPGHTTGDINKCVVTSAACFLCISCTKGYGTLCLTNALLETRILCTRVCVSHMLFESTQPS